MTSIGNLPSGWMAILWGVLTFSILIILHEGGHFLAARAFGVKVHEFMLGLPSPGIKWRSKRTGIRYGITILPLGGYVRIAGMEPGHEDVLLAAALGHLTTRGRVDAGALAALLRIPADRAAALLTTLEDYGVAAAAPDSGDYTPLVSHAPGEDDAALLARVRASVYRGQPTWKRVAILVAGVFVNIVAAILILVAALTLAGVPTPTTTVAGVSVGTPASLVGVKAGDVVVSFDGRPVSSWPVLQAALATVAPNVPVSMVVLRDGAQVPLRITPSPRPGGGGAYLGVISQTREISMPLGDAFRESFTMTGAVFVAIVRFFDPATFATSIQGARSIVGISYEVAAAANDGPLTYAWMVALLSLSLGIMNILPIPPLDGGKIAVELVERLFNRRVPRAVSIAFSAAGTLLLFSLIFYLMYADVVRYIIKG
jgi:regulator of sigma E protease